MRCVLPRDCSSRTASGPLNLRTLVRMYKIRNRPGAARELDMFRHHQSLKDAIEKAALAQDDRGKRLDHQRRHSPEKLSRATNLLMKTVSRFRSCSDFDELLALVEQTLAGLKGLNELYYYDTALRIGAFSGILPRMVYLHRGTRVCARNLGLNARARALDVSELPSEIRSLDPHEIEDFLCIYKDHFFNLSPNSRV